MVFRDQVILAVTSCLLTTYLTASTSFVTRKESGVLAPDFPAEPDSKRPTGEPKRRVLYYVSLISLCQRPLDVTVSAGCWKWHPRNQDHPFWFELAPRNLLSS